MDLPPDVDFIQSRLTAPIAAVGATNAVSLICNNERGVLVPIPIFPFHIVSPFK
jgi:hypothetical protein